ncbi:MAG: glycosyltransferase family A protein [Nitrososphaerota archaeon]|nr:glycosyltransferase family 2 protein [Candidatus Bathyarchaeota archaeon]MDW8049238.1 glycosyltransferase family A protein [Nitrososphaerota archaeon]
MRKKQVGEERIEDQNWEERVMVEKPSQPLIDVVMLTKNSERILKECVQSIYKNVPVRRLIIIDGFSTDNTIKIINGFQRQHENIVLIQQEGTRGMARQRALSEVETDWFMFVDSDVILCDGWFEKVKNIMDDDRVGAIWGMEIWSVLLNSRMLGLFERVNLKIFNRRGGTHDLLVRREAIKGIRIPPHLHTYEDSFIRSWIHKNGYRVIPVYDPYCIHYRPENVWTVSGSMNLIIQDIRYAIHHPQLILSYAFFTLIVLQQIILRKIKRTL